MLYPEEIYDLDTITLEEKVDDLEKAIRKLGSTCPKQMLQTLELAQLEIQQRRSIEQFGLDLQQDIKLFEQYRMYPVPEQKQVERCPPVGEKDCKETIEEAASHMTASSHSLFKKNRKQDAIFLDLLKRTRIDTVCFVTKATNAVINRPIKRPKQESKNQPTPTRRSSVSQRISVSTKKIPAGPVNNTIKTEAAKPKNTTRESLQSSGKVSTESSTSMSIRTHQVNTRTAAIQKKIPIIETKSQRQPQILKKSDLIKSQEVISQKIQPKKSLPIRNNIRFIQNDIYSDDEELMKVKPEDYQQIRDAIYLVQNQFNSSVIAESIPPNDQTQLQIQMNPPEQKIENEPKQQQLLENLKAQNISLNKETPLIEKQLKQEERVSTPLTPPSIQMNQYADRFDYFRLTVPKSRQNEEKILKTQQLPKSTGISQSPSSYSPSLTLIQMENIQQNINQTAKTPESNNSFMNKEHFDQPPLQIIATEPLIKAKSTSVGVARKTHGFAIHKLPSQIVKMVAQLPPIVTEYQHIIPTFMNLFSAGAQYVPLLWQLKDMLKTHMTKVSPKEHFKPNLSSNIDQFNIYVNNSCNKIKLWGNKVELDLSEFETKDNIARVRAANQMDPPAEKDILYYRVVKTKQQVYDIMTSTFNRTVDWAQLPHALNLKCSWNLLWTWAKPQIQFKKLIYFQKVNHFPHNKHLSRKDTLKKNIEKIKRLGAKTQVLFDIMPQSYLLPGENSAFLEKYLYYREKQGLRNLWIMKPIGMSRGRGISLIKDLNDVMFSEPVVIQKYLKNPLLLDGYKFDMRIYVLLTSVNPLEVFLYKQGFARLSTQKYTLDDESLKNNFIHLTNFAIQKQNYTSEGFSLGGTKISLKMLRQRFRSMDIQWGPIWQQVNQIVLKSCIASMNQIPPNPNCFQLFGYDIIIDSNLKCWLLEINSSPSLQRQFLLDQIVKQQLIDDTIQILDVPRFDRTRLLEVIQRRALQNEGRKSLINPSNNTVQQLNKDLHYILHGKPLRGYGEVPSHNGNYELIAPGPLYFSLIKSVQAYKITSLIRKP